MRDRRPGRAKKAQFKKDFHVGVSMDIAYHERMEEALERSMRCFELLAATAEELTRSNRDLKQFAYVSNHDLRGPQRTVAGFVQLLQDCYRTGAMQKYRRTTSGKGLGGIRAGTGIYLFLHVAR